jgi:phasin family protein
MANPRQDERNLNQSTQSAQDNIRKAATASAEDIRRTAEETTRKTAESAAQFSRTALEASEHVTRTSAEMMQQNAETIRRILQSGLQIVSQMGGRSAEEFGRVFGVPGDEVRQAHEQSSRNVDAIVETSSVLTQGMDSISREWFEFARKRVEQNLSHLNDLARCRTPHHFAAVQSEMLRDNIEDLLQSTRRVAEISARLAEEAMGKMTQNVEKAKRAA